MKTVWITRTDTQKPTALPAGWQAINAPLLTVSPAATAPEPPQINDVLIFTSGNGIKAFCDYTDKRDWPVHTVGDATAEIAKEAGFANIVSAGKDVRALSELIKNTPELKSKRLYYASGKDISGNLVADIKAEGFHIERQVVYDTKPISKLPKTLENKAQLTVLLYSPKGALAFRSIDLNFGGIEAISISANVDKTLSGLKLKARKIADHPSHDAMIKHLD